MKSIPRLINKIALGSIPFLVILIIWLIFYYFNQRLKWLIPHPIETAQSLWQLTTDGTILRLVSLSLLNLFPAFILATICAIALGTIIGINRTVRKIFFPFLSAIYPIPTLAWLPFVILFLGFTREAIWAVIFISSFMKIIYNVIGGVRNINIEHILAAKNFNLSKTRIVLQVVLPSAFPQIITGLRIGFGSAWRSLIGAEMLVATLGGLGKFIWMAQWFLDFNKVITGLIAISIISVIIEELIFKKIEKHTLIKWGVIHEEYV